MEALGPMYAVVPMLPVYQTPMSLTVCMCCCTAFLFILLQVCWVPLLLHELYLTRSSDKTLPDCSVCTSVLVSLYEATYVIATSHMIICCTCYSTTIQCVAMLDRIKHHLWFHSSMLQCAAVNTVYTTLLSASKAMYANNVRMERAHTQQQTSSWSRWLYSLHDQWQTSLPVCMHGRTEGGWGM